MSTYAKMRARRNSWRRKARVLRTKLSYQLRENRRVKRERDQYKKNWRATQQALDELKQHQSIQAVRSKSDLVFLALQLFLMARIGFRAVSRVLGVLAPYLGLNKRPCAQTISNWVTRLSLVRMSGAAPSQSAGGVFPQGYILLLDISIGLGQGKILTILALDPRHHGVVAGAPLLKHTRCLAVAVADTWNGETISALLGEVIAQFGTPVAYLKDGGTDLAKAVRVLHTPGVTTTSIDDISHYAANLLKHAFELDPHYPAFVQACGRVSRRLKQTVLACLAPPKVSTKARFMNLHRLVGWADRLLKQSPRGRAATGSLLQKLRDSLDQLPKGKRFIRQFLANAKPLLECQKILKTEGLKHTTYEACRSLVATIPHPFIAAHFRRWLDQHLAAARTLGLQTVGLPISSDSIESLFGVAKHLGSGEITDANRIALRIPALCQELTRADAEQVLQITVNEQHETVGSLPSLIKQRRDVFNNDGGLDTINDNVARSNIRLIRRSKSPQKTAVPIDNTENSVDSANLCPSPG